MSRWWKPSRNGKNDFEEVYYEYISGKISLTEFAYLQGISTMGVLKRIKYYKENNNCKYQKISELEYKETYKLMEQHINKIKNFDIKYQDKLTDVLYRTCLYIVRHKEEIENEENLIWFSLKRKIKDIKYEEYHSKEIEFDDKRKYLINTTL